MRFPELPEKVSSIPIKDSDGKYRWLHVTNLYRNPVFLLLVWKIFFFIWLGIAIFILTISVPGSDPFGVFLSLGSVMLYVLMFLLGLIAISYYIYALVVGGKYTVLFEMNEKGIRHTQITEQFNKAKKISSLAIFIGTISGNPNIAGTGFLAIRRQSMYTDFKKVRSVKINRRKYTIKLRSSDLTHNQIYTTPESFDFILGFIEEHTKK